MNTSKKKFRAKIITSYLVLGILALIAGLFILSEIKTYLFSENSLKKDTKLIKTSSLLTQLYKAESLSKMALQSKTIEKINVYTIKIDSIFLEIDSLKSITNNSYQKSLLDSVQILLAEKVKNSSSLWDLKRKKKANSSIDAALKEFNKMEVSFGRLTIQNFEKYPEKLSPYKLKILKNWVAYLNKNIPEESKETNTKKIDSIITFSKSLLSKIKEKDVKAQRSLLQKEMALSYNDLALSQQLQHIISALEQELNIHASTNASKKKAALKKSIRLAGLAAILGFFTVVIFTFLITKDFWNSQLYRLKLEKEKKYSESLLKSREQLISTVSHDLRTPLNTIIGYSELIENTNITNKQSLYLKKITAASGYVNSLVNDLLDFSKIEAGKITVENKPFTLSELITETATTIKEQYATKPITLIVTIDERLKNPVSGDSFRIQQIITNIITNAYKFTDKGTIKIEAFIKTKNNTTYSTLINVSDTGIGIKKEKQNLIFNEFSQAEGSTEKKYEGYGLGLAIAKKLTKLLNGSISLESQPQKGSTFSICIPLEIIGNKIVVNEIKKPIKTLSILIIDDDNAMLGLLKEICNNLQINTHTYSNFNNISEHENISYDFVLTDIQMPFINGFKVLKKLNYNSYSHYINQPIVAMTGRKDLEIATYKKAGFNTVIQKPFTKNQLLEVICVLFPNFTITEQISSSKKTLINTSSLFSLDIISSFLGDDKNSIKEIIRTFMTETSTNIKQLKLAVQTHNISTICDISHRMLPMFRQLKATEIVLILEKLEKLNSSEIKQRELKFIFINLKNKTTALQLALKNFIATNSNRGN